MFAKRLLSVCCILMGLTVCAPAQDEPKTDGPLKTIGTVLVQNTDGATAELTGIVIDTAFQRFGVIRDHTGYVLIRLPLGKEDVIVNRGDVVKVSGKIIRTGKLRNMVEADTVEVVSRAADSVHSTASSIAEILGKHDGEIVSAFGTVNGQKERYLFIKDDSGELAADLGDRWNEATFNNGDMVGVIGELDTELQFKRVIRIISLGQVGRFIEKEEQKAKPALVKEIVAGKQPGDKISVRGRVAEFIGDENVYFLFDGTNVLILRPIAAGQDVKFRAGEMLEVSGTYAVEEHDAKQYGAITEARIKKLQ